MSYKKKKMLRLSAVCIGMAVLMTQQIPAAALLQDGGVRQEENSQQERNRQQEEAVQQKKSGLDEAEQSLQDAGSTGNLVPDSNSTVQGEEWPMQEKAAGTEQEKGQQEKAAAGDGALGTGRPGQNSSEAAEQETEQPVQNQAAAGTQGTEQISVPSSDTENETDCREENLAKILAKKSSTLPAPLTVKAEKTAYNAVTLSWDEVEGAAGYQIEYTKDAQNYTVAGTAAADSLTFKCKNLMTGTKYRLRVCALDKNGNSGKYASVAAKPYLKKTKFTNVTSAEQSVMLEWKKVAGAMGYELYRKTDGQESYELIAQTEEAAYEDETASAGENYMYSVCAVRDVDGQTVKAKLSDAAEVSPEEPQPAPGMQFESCEPEGYSSAKLTWQKDDAAAGYYIYRSVKEAGNYRKIKTITNNQTLSYTDAKIVPGKAFFYKICSYTKDAEGTVTAGELSEAVSVQTKAEAPVMVSVNVNIANRSLSLEWEQQEGASGYRIYRSTEPDSGFKKITDRPSGTFVGYEDRAVAPGGTYYYRIKALYTNGSYKGLSQASDIMEGNLTPSAPIGLTVRQTDTDVLEISWNESPGAQSYNLYRSVSAKGTYTRIAEGLEENTYTNTGCADGRTYYYKVSASGAGGEGIQCKPVSYQTGGVSLNTRTLKLCVGVSKPLAFTAFSEYEEEEAEWTSDKPEIAEVNSEGLVTGKSYGTANVTVTVGGKKATASVSVTPGIRNGIDVSRWQEDVDWCRVKNSGIDFAFLRISNHYQEDYTFETKYMNASSVGMPLGVYCYSRAATAEEAQEEARIVLEILNGRKLEYPVAFDMEDAIHKSKTMTKEKLHQMIQAFKQVIEDAGYDFVLYSYLTFLNSNLDKTKLDGIDLWIARYRNVALGTGYTGTGNVKYWQYNSGQYSGSDFHVDGITNEAGELSAVDVNAEYE